LLRPQTSRRQRNPLSPHKSRRRMLRHTMVAVAILIGATTSASAQDALSPAGPQQTTWQLQNQALDKLLGEGWFIQSVAGDDGQILTLFKGNQRGDNKFMRCYLAGPKTENRRLDLTNTLFSTCRSLN